MLWRFLAVCFLGLASFGGCSSSDQADIDPAWTLDEHGNPDFKPADFDDAIASLKSSFGEVAAQQSPETSAQARKFRQILRWLPEFAADTPILRAGWEDLAARTARLESAARQPGFFEQDRADAFRQDLDAMAALIPPDPLYRKLNSRSKHDHAEEGKAGESHSPESPDKSDSQEAPRGNTAETEDKAPESKGNER
jgi:hypothetical protein